MSMLFLKVFIRLFEPLDSVIIFFYVMHHGVSQYGRHQLQHFLCLSHITLIDQNQIVVIFPPAYIASYLN